MVTEILRVLCDFVVFSLCKDAEIAKSLLLFPEAATMNAIPTSLAPFFQEYSLNQLDLERSASTIIERTLQFGSREEIRWLFACYSRQRICNWVRRWGQLALPEPHLTFWKLVLGLAETP